VWPNRGRNSTALERDPRLLSTGPYSEVCDIAEKYCDGYLASPSRHNIEFLLADKARSDPLIAELKTRVTPWGEPGIQGPTSSTPGWVTATPRPRMPSAPVKAVYG